MPTYPADPAPSFPVERTLEFDTAIVSGSNGTEQRWMRHPGRASWTLPYPYLSLAQRNALITFFEARAGAKETFDFVFLGVTYPNCYFESDSLAFTESQQGIITGSVKICQVTRAADAGVMPATFPVLASGNRVQLPYEHGRTFDTVSVRTEGGRYAYSKRAGVLRTWSAGGTVLTLADATALWEMFGTAQGRYKSFSFVDPDSGATHTARFASDSLTWTYVDAGHHGVQVSLQELV
jgi:hypothetical protein